MLMLWYPKCSTCQKAKAWLYERNLSCTVRDIKIHYNFVGYIEA